MSNEPAVPHFTSRELRDHLGLFPTGVAVITATTPEGERLGVTVSSFASVSLDPPLVSFNISNKSNAFKQWSSLDTFAVNVLSEAQSDVSTRFARALSDKWNGIDTAHGKTINAPLLLGALAWFECKTYAAHRAGDHLIILGEVQVLGRSVFEQDRPLVFFGGSYRRLDRDRPLETPFDESIWLHGW